MGTMRRPGFAPGSIHVGFVVAKVALGQVFLRVFQRSPVSISFQYVRQWQQFRDLVSPHNNQSMGTIKRLHWTRHGVVSTQFPLSQPTSLQSIIILTLYPRILGLPMRQLSQRFPTKTLWVWDHSGYTLKPNIVTKWLTLLFRIREVPGSNLGPEAGYLDWEFSWFSAVHSGKSRDNTLN
jgi:hypothetical protein